MRRREVLKGGATLAMAGILAGHERPARAAQEETHGSEMLSSIKALTFDVFGTVVDWRSSIIRDGQLLSQRKSLDIDWGRFADEWRAGYGPAMQRVRKGDLPWMKIDQLHRLILDDLLVRFEIDLDEGEADHFNRVWHRLIPWPDAVAGLNLLRASFIVSTLSNGNVSLLVNMAKNAGLPWDCVLSAELAKHYKPDGEVYLMAADLLGLEPAQVMMVAAHPGDLRAAASVGLRTALIPRPLERGPERGLYYDIAETNFDVTADDFLDLASKLNG